MTNQRKGLDLAQRIVDAMARTTKPTATAAGGRIGRGDKTVGAVPLHLRHLHNLLVELEKEMDGAEDVYRQKKERFDAVHTVFFDSLETNVPVPEGATITAVLENWDVAAKFERNSSVSYRFISNADIEEVLGLDKCRCT